MSSYEGLAASYDALTTDVGYEKRADFLEKLFRRSRIPVHTVLDLACGTGTTLVLAMFDVGTLVGAPLAGAILTITRGETGPNYAAMFGIVGLLIMLAGVVYFGVARRAPTRRGA